MSPVSESIPIHDQAHSTPAPGPAVTAALPPGPVFAERAAGALLDYLRARGLDDYRVFHCSDVDIYEVERHLEELGEKSQWEPAPSICDGGHPMPIVNMKETGPTVWDVGFLRLARHEAVFARWFWIDSYADVRALWLAAAPTPDHLHRLNQDLLRCRRAAPPTWQIVRTGGCHDVDDDSVPRAGQAADDLVLPSALRQRVEAEVISFFSDAVQKLYRTLDVPYRRGVLLHGAPGNGKTSIIRWIGAALPRVAAMILRPNAAFDSDDLQQVVQRWKAQAPCILVIEDLNWLLKRIDVSLFLNLLDGVERAPGGGLLLVATTNHPEDLDPALNSRPGRFDVVVEVPCPDKPARTEFLRRRLPETPDATRLKLAALCEGFSFAHIHEVLRVSGLQAIHEGRDHRSDADLIAAADVVRATIEDAARGFPAKLDLPFGLHHVRTARLEARQ